jgi:aminoglycoside phosphotransferase (APT) family kinase protein
MTVNRWSSRSWEADRLLTREMAQAFITACFPAIDSAELRHLGSGWEFDAFLTTDGWVFRFPRRSECANLFESEARVHRLVAAALPAHVSVPHVELIGPPMEGFPYQFAGHRFIPGVRADAIGENFVPTLARQIATVLGALHAVPEARARAAGIPEIDVDEEGRREWLERGLAASSRLQGLDPVVDRALTWLSHARLPLKPADCPQRLVHDDLSPEHVLANATTGVVSGILDWTDAVLGDAARDFVFLATWRGWRFVEQVLSDYSRTVDREFRTRIRSMAQLLSLVWLGFAYEEGGDLTNHIHLVRNAFASVGAS